MVSGKNWWVLIRSLLWQRFVFEGTVEKRSGDDWRDGSTRMSASGSWCRKMIALPPPWQQRQKLFRESKSF
jgi:hypothetical protein